MDCRATADPGLPFYSSDSGADNSHSDPGDDEDTDDYGFGFDDFEVCDFSKTYKDLDNLSDASKSLRTDCIAVYTLETLITMLDAAYADYKSVDDGYDKEFGYYVTYMKKVVPSVLGNSFMFDESHATSALHIPPLGPGMKCIDDTLLTLRVVSMLTLDRLRLPTQRHKVPMHRLRKLHTGS